MIFPFDPIRRSKEVESLVRRETRGDTIEFRFAKFYGSIVTADATGCNLLCAYCWNYSRSLNPSKAEELQPNRGGRKAPSHFLEAQVPPVQNLWAESILGQASAMHLADVIKLVGGKFIVETNGIAIGYDPGLLDHLTERR